MCSGPQPQGDHGTYAFMRIFWAKRARLARNALIEFIAQDNALAAIEIDDTITAASRRLAEFPLMGKAGRIAGTRELIVHEHYALVYELENDSLTILMVLHSSRQWPAAEA